MPSNSASPAARIAVCSWSLQPKSAEDLIAQLKATGIARVQLALDPLRESPNVWGNTAELLRKNGITLVSGMFGCVGEDYTTLETIRVTGGIAPDKTWDENSRNIRESAILARELGLRLVTFHAGFLPHDENDPGYKKMLARLEDVAGVFESAGLDLGLETGQETAADLSRLLRNLDRPNVGVNFDPANMILYGKGDPIEAVGTLAPWIRQVHIKDATRTKEPGAWGTEVPAGTGEVHWPAFFGTLKNQNYAGDFVIEREAGNQRVADIRTAKAMVEKTA